MLDFGCRKQGFHIQVSIDESSGDNTVVVTMINDEGNTVTATGTIVFDE